MGWIGTSLSIEETLAEALALLLDASGPPP